MPITARELRAHFGRARKPAPKPADRIAFASAGLVRKTRKFEIYNVSAGEVLGTYEAHSAGAALNMMARDFGDDFADDSAVIGIREVAL